MGKNYFFRLYSVGRMSCRTTHSRSLNAIIMLVLLCFTVVASGTLKPAEAQEARHSSPPLIVLHHGIGNFFVLASDIPFKVRQAEPKVPWMEVEVIEGDQTAHRTVSIKSHPENLSRATYYSAIRVDLSTSKGADYLLIPVALRVGKEFERKFRRDALLEADIPDANIRLQPDDPSIDVRFVMTPGGHYILEIIDRDKENTKRQQLPQSAQSKPTQMLSAPTIEPGAPDALSQTYEIVLPWMCLEYPCGRTMADDIADVEPNLDAVNSVSYERYTLSGGWWGIYDVGDPGLWADQAALKTWPMVTGGYNPSASDIQAMWDNRVTIANHMIAEALENGYQGYCIDVEGHADAATKNIFINLMDYYAGELHAHGYQLMVVHATWSTIAPIADLAETAVDYVATMDPYTSLWYDYIPVDYHAIEHDRLIWGFTWDGVSADTQQEMWQWMQQGGYNAGVAGAAAWRTPLMPPHPGNDVDYYQGFRNYYPPADFEEERPDGDNVARAAIGWEASSSFSADYGGDKAYDGVISAASKWTSDGSGAESWLALDLGKDYDVTGFIVRHSGAADEWRSFNLAAYRLESGSSLSGPWTVLTAVDNSAQQDSTTTVLESNARTRYVRLFITDAGVDNYARIPEFEIYGTAPPDEGVPSITGGEPKGPFGSGEQSDEETEPGTWRWSERFYGHQGIDQITWQADGCGVQHNYVIGLDQNDLIEYAMKFGGDYSRLILRGLADRPGPVELEIYIDGNYAATAVWDNDNDCNQDVAVEIPGLPYGTHAIAVKFVNDFYDPANGVDRNFYLDGLLVAESESAEIPSITGGEPKGPFGSGEQSDEETEAETWRWSERFYGHQGIDQITWQADGCGVQHNYAIGWHQNDLIEYLMKFGGQYPWLILRGIADRPGPVEFDVYIDGQYAASEAWDRSSDCNQEVGVEIPGIPYGTHAIAVQFTNDYHNPATWEDRNFYLDALKAASEWNEPAPTWAYPVGAAETGAGWHVTNPLGNSWYSSTAGRWYRGHLGEDWFKLGESSYGQPVYAAAAGKVVTVLNNCGNYVDVVIIEHSIAGFEEPIYSFYGHLEANGYVSAGDSVEKRQQIGVLGDPVTFNPHLHFEIKNRTALVNPPFSTCSDIPNETYIGAGYSGISDDYDAGDYYDPTDGIFGNRHYHPTRFIENRK